MRETISAGQNQQLEKMTPEERMTVLASNDFKLWQQANYPYVGAIDLFRVKSGYVAGFFNGLDRGGRAFMARDQKILGIRKAWLESVGIIGGVGLGILFGGFFGFFFIYAIITTPVGH